MKEAMLERAALQFGQGKPNIELLGEGLIHKTYKVSFEGNSEPIVLQNINRVSFRKPENIIHNYQLVYDSIAGKNGSRIPPLVHAKDGRYFWIDEDYHFWRAIRFVKDSYTVSFPRTPEEARITATCFGNFTKGLADMDTTQLEVIIPGFHDLSLRYDQFEQAVKQATAERLLRSTHIISELRQRQHLVDFYNGLLQQPADYKVRVMHHDCKLSNILLDTSTNKAVCPVDLDTVMPGLYFSDVGDMIRSMAGTVDENSIAWEEIAIRKDFYTAIIEGYREGIGDSFTAAEQQHIHHAGLMMLYMQALRFIADFLNNDIYYKITYPEQNFNRAMNQLLMLEKLEEFLKEEYDYQ